MISNEISVVDSFLSVWSALDTCSYHNNSKRI